MGRSMEITTVVGIIVGFIAVIGAMYFKGISYGVFRNPAAIFVIFVGTIATILNSYPGKNLKCLGKLFKVIFTSQGNDNQDVEMIREFMRLSSIARKEGLLSLENEVEKQQDPFMKKGIRMIIDGMTEDYIKDVLTNEIDAMEERHELNASIFSSAGGYAPTLGVLGAVFGLIAAMSHINDTDRMAEAISAAFIATILGIFTGYVLWNPFATKLKTKTQDEVLMKNMTVEGILSIYHGESSSLIKEKMLSWLSESRQREIEASLGDVKEGTEDGRS